MGLYQDEKKSCSSASSLNSSRVQKERPTVLLLPVNAIQTEAYGNSVHISLSPPSRELSVSETVNAAAIVQTLAADNRTTMAHSEHISPYDSLSHRDAID